jgi:hypothetical protein
MAVAVPQTEVKRRSRLNQHLGGVTGEVYAPGGMIKAINGGICLIPVV